jgi:hypothetical protein
MKPTIAIFRSFSEKILLLKEPKSAYIKIMAKAARTKYARPE